VILVRSV